MPLAQHTQIASIGGTARIPGEGVIDLTPARPSRAPREAAGGIPGQQERTQGLGDPIALATPIQEVPGERVRDQAPQGEVIGLPKQFAQGPGIQRPTDPSP